MLLSLLCLFAVVAAGFGDVGWLFVDNSSLVAIDNSNLFVFVNVDVVVAVVVAVVAVVAVVLGGLVVCS